MNKQIRIAHYLIHLLVVIAWVAELLLPVPSNGLAHAHGLSLFARQNTGGFNYMLPDALGSIRQVTNNSGQVILSRTYDPFGNLLSSTGAGATPFGFAGDWSDTTGLSYLISRYYSPAQGRFITKDPVPGIQILPAGLNPYVYALNSPVLYTDHSGQFIDTLFDLASVGLDLYNLYDIYKTGCGDLTSAWSALGWDTISFGIPFLPAIGGWALRGATHLDDFSDLMKISRAADQFDEIGDALKFTGSIDNIKPQKILFGQARVGPKFSTKSAVPNYLKGRLIKDVAQDLEAGVLHADDILIKAFEHNGQLITVNNRGLAALSKAGIAPTNVQLITTDYELLRRLEEISVLGDVLPSRRIAITPHMKSTIILDIIQIVD